MKSYLLIDLDKMAKDYVLPNRESNKVFVFAKKKKNRQWAADLAKHHANVSLVKIAKDEKLAAVLVEKLEKLLKKQPAANVLIESPREKIAKRVDKLLNRYPEAHILLSDFSSEDDDSSETAEVVQPEKTAAEVAPQPEKQVTEKKTKNKQAETQSVEKVAAEPQPENPQPATKTAKPQPENKLIGKPELHVPDNKFIERQEFKPFSKTKNKLPEIKGSKKVKPKLIDIELPEADTQPADLLDKLTQNHQNAEADRKLAKMLAQPEFDAVAKRLDALMNVLKKAHIKKKDALVRELAQNLNLSQDEATSLLTRLQSFGIVNIDADTVKFNNLMNLLKLR